MNILLGPYSKSGSGISTYLLELTKALGTCKEVELTLFGFEPRPYVEDLMDRINWLSLGKDIAQGIAFLPLQAWLNLKVARKLNERSRNFEALHSVSNSVSVNLDHPNLIVTGWSLMVHPLAYAKDITKFYKFPLSFVSPVVLFQSSLVDRLCFKRTNKIVCVTRRLAELLSEIGFKNSIYVPPPISIQYTPKQRVNRKEIVDIFYVARDLSLPRKNLRVFLRLLIELDKMSGPKRVCIHLIGKETRWLPSFISGLKNLRVKTYGFLGREKLGRLYDAASNPIYVSTSIYEELNYSLIEALSKGCVPVVSDIPSHRELVIDGETGYLCNPYNPWQFLGRLKQLIDNYDLLEKFRLKSIAYISENHNPNSVAKKMLRLYLAS